MGYMNYEERLEVAKRLYELSNAEQKTALEYIFPELCESEDEKVKEDIISLVNEFWERIGSINPEYSSRSRMLDWLEKQGKKDSSIQQAYEHGYVEGKRIERKHWIEKQGEKKPTDEDMVEALRTEYEKGRADAFAQMQQGWSDKEKQMYADIIEATKKSGVFKEVYKRELVDFLNSLKDRYTWKPSEEQIDALADALSLAKNCGEEGAFDLRTLYEQLEKLKGE